MRTRSVMAKEEKKPRKPPSDRIQTVAYVQGRRAAAQGLGEKHCPYESCGAHQDMFGWNESRKAWFDGWLDWRSEQWLSRLEIREK